MKSPSRIAGVRLTRPVLAAGAALVAVAVGAGAWVASGGGQPAAAGPSPLFSSEASASARPTATRRPSASPSPSPSPTPVPGVACPLDGMPVDDEALLEIPALAVTIENHPAARPARNLGEADMVVEATVEGDITRYTGIFLCERTEGMTGPVRSARYYTIDLWQDLHVLPYFFGAHLEAIGRFDAAGTPYVNGLDGGWPGFRRWGTNGAPHNLYSDLEQVRSAFATDARLQALADRVPAVRPPFAFSEEASLPEGRPVRHVELWTNGYWHFGWAWSSSDGHWEREEAGVRHVDAGTETALSARTVVVQLVVEDVVWGPNDPAGNPRRFHHLVGSGEGILYVEGRAIDVRWSRPTAGDGTTWTYADGGERVVLPPGVVWWEIVPLSTRVVETAG